MFNRLMKSILKSLLLGEIWQGIHPTDKSTKKQIFFHKKTIKIQEFVNNSEANVFNSILKKKIPVSGLKNFR